MAEGRDAVDKLNDSIGKLQQSVGELQSGFSSLAKAFPVDQVNKLSTSYFELSRRTGLTSSQFDKLQESLKRISKDTKIFSEVELANLTKQLRTSATALGALSTTSEKYLTSILQKFPTATAQAVNQLTALSAVVPELSLAFKEGGDVVYDYGTQMSLLIRGGSEASGAFAQLAGAISPTEEKMLRSVKASKELETKFTEAAVALQTKLIPILERGNEFLGLFQGKLGDVATTAASVLIPIAAVGTAIIGLKKGASFLGGALPSGIAGKIGLGGAAGGAAGQAGLAASFTALERSAIAASLALGNLAKTGAVAGIAGAAGAVASGSKNAIPYSTIAGGPKAAMGFAGKALGMVGKILAPIAAATGGYELGNALGLGELGGKMGESRGREKNKLTPAEQAKHAEALKFLRAQSSGPGPGAGTIGEMAGIKIGGEGIESRAQKVTSSQSDAKYQSLMKQAEAMQGINKLEGLRAAFLEKIKELDSASAELQEKGLGKSQEAQKIQEQKVQAMGGVLQMDERIIGVRESEKSILEAGISQRVQLGGLTAAELPNIEKKLAIEKEIAETHLRHAKTIGDTAEARAEEADAQSRLSDIEKERFSSRKTAYEEETGLLENQESIQDSQVSVLQAQHRSLTEITAGMKKSVDVSRQNLALAKERLAALKASGAGPREVSAQEKVVAGLQAKIAEKVDYVRRTWMESMTKLSMNLPSGTFALPGETSGAQQLGTAYQTMKPYRKGEALPGDYESINKAVMESAGLKSGEEGVTGSDFRTYGEKQFGAAERGIEEQKKTNDLMQELIDAWKTQSPSVSSQNTVPQPSGASPEH